MLAIHSMYKNSEKTPRFLQKVFISKKGRKRQETQGMKGHKEDAI